MEELLGLGLGFVAIILTFSIPLTAIWTNHLRKTQKVRAQIVKDEIELEKLRYNNFLVETEKMRLDLQTKQNSLLESTDPIILDLQKRSTNEAQILSR